MSFMSLVIAILCTVIQLLAIAFLWLLVIETKANCLFGGYDVYKKYWQFFFWVSTIMGMVMWLTTKDIDNYICYMFIISIGIWLISGFIFLFLSIGKKMDYSLKTQIRSAAKVAVGYSVILSIFTWLIYV